MALTIVPVLSETVIETKRGEGILVRSQVPPRVFEPSAGRQTLQGADARGSPFYPSFSAGWAATRIGTEFIPTLDEGSIAINVVRLPNASLEGSLTVGTYMEKRILAEFPEVQAVVSKTGRAEISEDPMGPEQTDILIMLKPPREWPERRTKSELVAAMQAELSKIPGVRLSFSQPIALRVNELISGVKSDLAVKVYGADIGTLKSFADRIVGVLSGVAGASDARVEQVSGMEHVEIAPDRVALARYGLNVSDVNEVIETALAGTEATKVVDGNMRIATIVRFPEGARGDIEAIQKMSSEGKRRRGACPRRVSPPSRRSRDRPRSPGKRACGALPPKSTSAAGIWADSLRKQRKN